MKTLILCTALFTVAAGAQYEYQVRDREGEVRALAREYDKARSEVSGIVTVQFTVGTDGAVKDTSVVASMVMNPAFERDLVNLIAGWTFADPEKYDVIIAYPFVFHKQDYKRTGKLSFVGYTGAGREADECADEVVSRAGGNESLALRAYSRLLDAVSGSAGLLIISLYLDEYGDLSRTSCSYSEIDDPIFKDKMRNWLGCNVPVGLYPDARIMKIAVRFEPERGASAEELTEDKFKRAARAYEDLASEIYAGGAPEATLTVEVTVGSTGKVKAVEAVESTVGAPAVEAEIVTSIYNWVFPEGTATVTYRYRFDF